MNNVELFELHLMKLTPQPNDVNGNEKALLDSVHWVKSDLESGKHEGHDGERITQNGYFRLITLMKFKQCFSKAVILLDVPRTGNSGHLISDVLGEQLAEKTGVEKERIQFLFLSTGYIKPREERPDSQTKQACEISIAESNDFQNPQKVVQSMINRRNAASANAERVCTKFQRACSNICPWRMNYRASEVDEDSSLSREKKRPKDVQIYVGAMKTFTKLQMIFARLCPSNGNSKKKTGGESGGPRFLIFIIGPSAWQLDYLELGRCCAVAFSNQIFVSMANKASNPDQFRAAVDRFINSSVVIPPEPHNHWNTLKLNKIKRVLITAFAGWSSDGRRMSTDSEKSSPYATNATACSEPKRQDSVYDPLRRTGRLFHGFANDIRHRYRDYASDLTDAIRMKCLVATILTFFNTFTSAIALGEVLGTKTKRWMGLSEVLVAQCVCGLLWGFVAGQPLIIQTTTAAFVMFEGSLYKFCDAHGLDYLVLRVWTGGWVLLITFFMVMLETPFLIRYVTRFTEEVFDALISVAFIYESLLFLFETFEVHPLRDLAGYCALLNSSPSKDPHQADETTSNLVTVIFGATTMATRSAVYGMDNATRGHGMLVIREAGHEFSPIPEEEFHYDHGTVTGQPNSALLTLILMMATFFLASYLDSLKRSFYFGRTFREMIGNFSVPITLPMIALAADLLFQSTHIHRVNMAEDFAPTEPERRGWLVNPLGESAELPTWAIFAAIAPAFLVSILLFVELELAEISFARKERGLRKGSGFHLDLLLSGLLMFICGLMGLPWLGAGPVQSRAHLSTLTVRQRAPPGEDAKIDYVVEQRLTTVAVALLLGACAFLGRVLVRIPVAVLMGVFVYLGVRSLCELQFVRRVILYIVPRKYYPDSKYCQQVPMWRMHFYTAVQIMFFAALFAVEVVPQISVVFPFVVTIIAVFRHIFLPLAFKEEELNSLDAEQEDSDVDM